MDTGTNFLYYWYLVRFSVSHFCVASAPKIIAMFVYKMFSFLAQRNFKKVEVSLVSAKVKP